MVLHSIGDEFIIPNSTAKDYLGNDITSNIETDHDFVNVYVEGIYRLYWYVADDEGNIIDKEITIHVIDNTSPGYNGNYYNGINPNNNLQNQLYQLVNDFNYTSYDAAKTILAKSDMDPNNSSNLLQVYNRKSVSSAWATNPLIWNREHVVPQSILKSYLGEGTSAVADIHNLKPADEFINSNRGNLKFVDGFGTYKKIGNGWYPGDDDKGDIARIVFFMLTKYPNIAIEAIGNLATFLEWHISDPVDDFEMNRNNVLFDYTNSRNPYIDNPEWVNIVFGTQTFTLDEVIDVLSYVMINETITNINRKSYYDNLLVA